MAKAIKEILQNEDKFRDMVSQAFRSVTKNDSGLNTIGDAGKNNNENGLKTPNGEANTGPKAINVYQLEQIMTQITNDLGIESLSPDDNDKLLKHYDNDGSGEIDFDEYSIMIRDVLEALMELQLSQSITNLNLHRTYSQTSK